jgi:thiol-disulfide isomerase/thioredoxin
MRLKFLILMSAFSAALFEANAQNVNSALGERLSREVMEEKFAAKKLSNFHKIHDEFPDTGVNAAMYDQARYSIAMSMADAKQTTKVVEIIKSMSSVGYKNVATTGAAVRLADQEAYNDALFLLKPKMDEMEAIQSRGGSNAYTPEFIAAYNNFTIAKAKVLNKKGAYREAMELIKPLYNQHDPVYFSRAQEPYIIALAGLGKKEEAFQLIKHTMLKSATTNVLKEEGKEIFLELFGNESDYALFVDSTNMIAKRRMKESIASKLMERPAPDFALTDVNGKEVSLNSYKGKVVMLDFWSTWCQPCKRTFPVMQKVVNKFKSDTGVVFLFVHSFETEKDPGKATAEAAKYMMENNYPFKALMDLRSTTDSRVAKLFEVNGLPSKFIIDGKGNIRFSLSDLDEDDDAEAEQIAQMIGMAEKGVQSVL